MGVSETCERRAACELDADTEADQYEKRGFSGMQAVSERWVLRFPDFNYASFFRVHSALCICRAACFSATLLINLSLFITKRS